MTLIKLLIDEKYILRKMQKRASHRGISVGKVTYIAWALRTTKSNTAAIIHACVPL